MSWQDEVRAQAGRRYSELGEYSDFPVAALNQDATAAAKELGGARGKILETLAFGGNEAVPEVTEGKSWVKDGVAGIELSWDVGYGPRTRAWLLRPAGYDGPLPGVLALSCHAYVKYYGKEKLASGPDSTPGAVQGVWDQFYAGRAWADELARQGFTVLVHDVFMWGSRRFEPEAMFQDLHERVAAVRQIREDAGEPLGQDVLYDLAALEHETIVAKYCDILGTSMAGVVASEDRIAAAYLASRDDVLPGGIGCIGFSGGGARSSYLTATSDYVSAASVNGMMCSYSELLDHLIAPHTGIFYPPGLSSEFDWPEIAASSAPRALLVQNGKEDPMFTPKGMQISDDLIKSLYAAVGAPDQYQGKFYDVGHEFTAEMQDTAFAWLKKSLS